MTEQIPPLPPPDDEDVIVDYSASSVRSYARLCMRLAREKALEEIKADIEKLRTERDEARFFMSQINSNEYARVDAAIRAMKQEKPR